MSLITAWLTPVMCFFILSFARTGCVAENRLSLHPDVHQWVTARDCFTPYRQCLTMITANSLILLKLERYKCRMCNGENSMTWNTPLKGKASRIKGETRSEEVLGWSAGPVFQDMNTERLFSLTSLTDTYIWDSGVPWEVGQTLSCLGPCSWAPQHYCDSSARQEVQVHGGPWPIHSASNPPNPLGQAVPS